MPGAGIWREESDVPVSVEEVRYQEAGDMVWECQAEEGCSNLKLSCVLYHFAADWHNAVVMLYKEQVQSCCLPPEEGAVLLSLLLLLSFWKERGLIPV